MRVDLHCHSEASSDCYTPLRPLGLRAVERGISVLAITDHNTIDGAKELRRLAQTDPALADLEIIVGEEITTTEGEVIGLFLEEEIPRRVTPQEAVEAIRAQSGLVLLPHGFDPFKSGRLDPVARNEIADEIDIVETFNRRISLPRYNRAAEAWATARGKDMSAGSDAHTLGEVGRAWLDVPDRPIRTPRDLLAALPEGSIAGQWRQPILAFAQKMWVHLVGER